MARQAKVADACLTPFINEDVGRLKVSVQNGGRCSLQSCVLSSHIQSRITPYHIHIISTCNHTMPYPVKTDNFPLHSARLMSEM